MTKKTKIILGIVIAIAVILVIVAYILVFSSFEKPDKVAEDDHMHEFTDKQVLREASCTQDGIVAMCCTCGKEELEIVPSTGHNLGLWKTDKEATCTDTGIKKAVCIACNEAATEDLPRIKHAYEAVLQDQSEDTVEYTCTYCKDSFTLSNETDVDLYSSGYISDCDDTYSFDIYCEQDAAYIREHLYITDAYYHNTDKQKDIPYELEEGYGSVWTVSPVTPYTPGNIYLASRSGEVFFEGMAVNDMTFRIYREESKEMLLSEDVIFLQNLEDKSSGYYPYVLEYSEASSTYWLSLKKAKGLEVGDIICVGDARSLEDVIAQTGEPDVFGEITFINYDAKTKTYFIEMASPDLTKMFSVLNIYSTEAVSKDNIQFASEDELINQTKQLLYQSDDFANLMCAVQDTSVTYLSARGYTTTLSTIQDFFNSIDINKEKSEIPYISDSGEIRGKIVVSGEVVIPITLNSDPDSEQLGNIKFYFEAGISLDSLKILLNLENQEVDIEGEQTVVKAQIGTQQQLTVSFTMGAEVNMDWSLEAKPYVLNTNTGKYHFKTCKHVSAVKDSTALQKMSAETLFEKIANETVLPDNECKTCLPVSSMMADSYILNTETKTIHLYECTHAKRLKGSKVEVSTMPYGNILASGYSECGDCNPSSRYTNSFSEQVLQNMKSTDLTDSLETFKELAKQTGSGKDVTELELASIPFTITGLDAIELQLSVYFNFNLEATLEYKNEVRINSEFGIYVSDNGFVPYSHSTDKQIQNDITLLGKARVDVGLQAGINIHLIGLEKYCYADLSARAGVYAKLHGALKHDFIYGHTDYAAAYFEAGIHVDLVGDARLAFWKTGETSFIPEENSDIPLMRYGYERIFYNFKDMPDTLTIDTIYYDLEKADLFNARYYDIIKMEEGEDKLSVSGIKDKYDVEYILADGSYCTVSDGYLLVTDPDRAFSDELTIKVTGYDEWGKYRIGNTHYNIESATILIHYDPYSNKAQIPDEAAEYNGHRYHLFSLPKDTTYEEAVMYCTQAGGYPCTVTTGEESDFVEEYLLNTGKKDHIFFGLEYDTEAAAWTWNNGETFDYSDWEDDAESTIYAVLSEEDEEYDWTYTFKDSALGEEMLMLCEWGNYISTEGMTAEERMDDIVGYYQGWYTATQGITGGAISVHRTNALLKDEKALKMYANLATECSKDSSGNITQEFTVEDIRKIVNGHTEEYIAIYMFGPLRENPTVEDGLYTMSITYNESEGSYEMVGKEWIQHDTYVFADIKNVSLQGGNFFGGVYGNAGFFGTYEKIGELAMVEYTPKFES